MRTWVGHRIDDGTTAVFAFEQPSRPSLDEVGDMLRELGQLSDNPASDPAWEADVLARKRDLIEHIEASERAVPVVVPIDPPSAEHRFDWGEDSPAAAELARSLLTDAVGDSPPDEVAQRYVAEVLSFLPKDRFRIDATDLHEWLSTNGLFVEAELVAHRGGLDPNRPALRVITPDDAPTGDPTAGGAPDPATASALVAACEQAWADIQRHHPDVPHAVVVLGSGVERGRLVKLGHWWGGRWLADGEVRGEVLLAGEALHLPAEQVFEVLLHEAAHGLNAARGVKDSSRGRRYHNKRFQATAELVGLDVAAMSPYGWARTTLTAETAERYGEAIDRLGDAMRIARAVDRPSLGAEDTDAGGDGRSGTGEQSAEETEPRPSGAAMCGCGRRMRMAPSVLAAGPVLCGLCGAEFQRDRQTTRATEHEAAAVEQGDTVVDHSFLPRRQEALAAERTRSSPAGGPEARLAAFISAAREAGFGAHPAVVALAHHHNLLAGAPGTAGEEPPVPPLSPVQREGLVEIALAGDKPGDWAVASWYQALGTEQEQPMPAGDLAEAGRRRNLARAMLKADGTLHGPAVEVLGRVFLAGERIVVGPTGIRSLELDGGTPGTVEQVDDAGQWLEVDFPTAGHYRFATEGPEAAALAYGYAEVVQGLDRIDLRTLDLDLRPPIQAEPVPTVQLPEIDL